MELTFFSRYSLVNFPHEDEQAGIDWNCTIFEKILLYCLGNQLVKLVSY